MDIKQKYREELNKEPYCQTKTGAYVKSGTYSDDYVKWLEKQCTISDVVGRSEQLKAFREWWNKDNEGVFTTITHKDIERYLESL